MVASLTLYSPWTCLTISSESPTRSSSVAPSAARRSIPSSSARYSATLLVARPIALAALVDDLAVGVADDRGDRRRAGVAAGAAVDVDDDAFTGAQPVLADGPRPLRLDAGQSEISSPFPTRHCQSRAERSSDAEVHAHGDLDGPAPLVVDAPRLPSERAAGDAHLRMAEPSIRGRRRRLRRRARAAGSRGRRTAPSAAGQARCACARHEAALPRGTDSAGTQPAAAALAQRCRRA